MLQRLKDSIAILLGRAKARKEPVFSGFDTDFKASDELRKKIDQLSIEFIFTEFGEERVNAGGADFSEKSRLEPSLIGIKKFFPNAKITVFTDFDWGTTEFNIQKVKSPVVDSEHPRFGYRTGNYFKFKGLIESEADFVCALDSDMFFVNENVYSLITLTEKFGFCAPNNPRELLNYDMRKSFDTQTIEDLSMGNGRSYNQSPMTLWKGDERGTKYYQICMETMRDDPSRGSLVMWKAAWKTGLYPYVLPKQFCVCAEDINCKDEVILHIGHPKVAKFYQIKS